MRVVLLLNLAILVSNFVVSLGATETQVRLVRTTARAAFDGPVAAPAPGARGPATRLVKYLGRLERLADLTPRQVRALCLALDDCSDELAQGGEALRRGLRGAHAQRLLGDLRARVERKVESTLRAADVADGELLARLVRIVVASAG